MLEEKNGSNLISMPAGFWLRFWAWLADFIIIGIIIAIVNFFVWLAFGVSIIAFITSLVERGLTGNVGGLLAIGAIILGWLGTILVTWLVSQIIGWLYYAFFESTQPQATPGKLLLSLKVNGPDSEQISFGRATLRHIFKSAAVFPALLFLLILGITIGTNPSGESLKPIGILFGLSLLLSPLLFLIFYGMAGWTDEKRALHDKLSGCYVVRKTQLSGGRMFATAIGIIICFLLFRLIIPGLWDISRNIKVEKSSNKIVGGEVDEQ